MARNDEIGDDALVQVEVALVFAEIANVMALGQNAPDLWLQTQRVRQKLKNNVAVAGSVPMPAQGCQAKRMCGVVSQVEAALQRKPGFAGVLQARQTRTQQARKLLAIGRLRPK